MNIIASELRYKNKLRVINGYSDEVYDYNYYNEIPYEENVEQIYNISEYCKENDIQLVTTKVPVIYNPKDYPNTWTKNKSDYIKELFDNAGIIFFDPLYDSNLSIDIKKDYIDGGMHLNYRGAKKLSKCFADFLHSECKMVGKGYDKYDEMLLTYNQENYVFMLETETELEKYCKLLNDLPFNHTIMFSGNERNSSLVATDIIARITSTASNTDNVNNESLAAIISNRELEGIYLDDGYIVYEYNIGDSNKVRIDSGIIPTFEGEKTSHNSRIAINDINYSFSNEGLNIVVFDDNLGIVIDSINVKSTNDNSNGKQYTIIRDNSSINTISRKYTCLVENKTMSHNP